MAVGLSVIGGYFAAATATVSRPKSGPDKKPVTAEDAFNRSQKKVTEKTNDAFAKADARLSGDIAAAKAKGDKAAVKELTAKQEGLRTYAAAAGAPRPAEADRTTAASGREALQGAVARAARNTQEVLTRADEKLTSQIKAATERGDASAVKDLTAKQAQLRAAIGQVTTDAAAQTAAFAGKLKGAGTSGAASSAAGAAFVAAQKTAAEDQKVLNALSDRAEVNRKALKAGASRSRSLSILD